MPLVLATDLDGTLLRSDGLISPRTREALLAAERAGVVVLFVTARPMRWLDGLRDLVGGHGTVICANGAVVLDLPSGRVLEHTAIDRESALAAVARIRAAVPGVAFARESLSGFGREPAFVPRFPPPAGSPIGPMEQVLDDAVVKLLVRHEVLDRDALFSGVLAALDGLLPASISGDAALVELSAPGVSKASALARTAARLGADAASVTACGDMVNDLPMLAWAGRAVAVANADPRVLAAADEVVPANDEDGVATVLERLLAR